MLLLYHGGQDTLVEIDPTMLPPTYEELEEREAKSKSGKRHRRDRKKRDSNRSKRSKVTAVRTVLRERGAQRRRKQNACTEAKR